VVAAGLAAAADRLVAVSAICGLVVADIEVEGRETTDVATIMAALGAARGTPILAVSPGRAKEQLESLPWVRSATIERRLPGTLFVRLVERRPLAVWQHGGKQELIDRDGEVISVTDLSPFARLPTLVGEGAAPHAAALIDKLGDRYEITRTAIKKWTVGSPIQGPLDALEILLKRRPFEADQVQEVVVRMNPGSVVDNREMPDVCIQHMLAVMMIDKTATFRSAHDKPRMQDPGILRQRAKVRLDPRAEKLVVITLNDGTRMGEDVAAVLGTAGNPMSRDQVIAKCRDLMVPVLGASATAKLIERTLDLENVKSIRELRPLLQRA